MSKIFNTTPDVVVRRGRPCTVSLHLVTCKKEAPQSDGDTSGVSANGTLMLKSVVVLVSKQRGRALARKNCPYLNRWADPLFIGVPHGLGCLGDPVRLNSECSMRGTQRHASVGRGDEYCLVRGDMTRAIRDPQSRRCSAVVGEMLGNAVRANKTGPDHVPLWVGSGERQVLREGYLTARHARGPQNIKIIDEAHYEPSTRALRAFPIRSGRGCSRMSQPTRVIAHCFEGVGASAFFTICETLPRDVEKIREGTSSTDSSDTTDRTLDDLSDVWGSRI
ncbi:hypothetical protein TIFTF001_035684 [Ficus carica]|uniref:Uncharacterized protein n=1 Tax=Ficus carica TaxID=3494 RepID=A0AA88E598_FICCA|nr:hypothetical protein TIFTF001_035684 [Ficus carica]